jgi:uncharacterized protein (TIGR02118 family)
MMIVVSAVYPNNAGSRFDPAYYLESHAAFANRLLRPYGLTALRLTTGSETLDGQAPPFWAIAEMHFESRAALDRAIAECGDALFADVANYTDATPILQISILADRP